jgi:predicted CoA-binding protein
MVTQKIIDDFLAGRRFAVVGVSARKRGFGYAVFHDLKKKGYEIFPVNPNAASIDGETCYPDLHSLPAGVDGIVLVVPPEQTERVVRDAARAGITRVWMQQGAESNEAIAFCEQNGMAVVHGECIMMFAPHAAFPHKVHKWIKGVAGKLPE